MKTENLKVLVIEDNIRKKDKTVGYIQKYIDETGIHIDIDHVVTIKESFAALADIKYDGVIIDMQLPFNRSDGIDIVGGIKVLDFIIFRDIGCSYIINSSSGETRGVLDKNGYSDTKLIINAPGKNCTSAFNKFLKKL